jgi:hypothetical protein
MSKNNTNLITEMGAGEVAGTVNAAGIGGGVVEIYDMQEPRDGELGNPFGKTTDPDEPDAKMYGFTFANGASGINAELVRRMIEFNPTRWIDMLSGEVAAQAADAKAKKAAENA